MAANDDETATTLNGGTGSSSLVLLRCALTLLGFTGVGLGAWGTHGLKQLRATSSTTPTQRLDNWKTAVTYQLIHAVTIFSISVLCETLQLKQDLSLQSQSSPSSSSLSVSPLHLPTNSPSPLPPKYYSNNSTYSWYERAGYCMTAGSVLFSSSIYLLCLDIGPKKLWGPTTPIGGLLLLTGWAMLFTASATRTGTMEMSSKKDNSGSASKGD